MSQEYFWILFAKKLAGEATPAELTELENLVKQHPEWQYSIQSVEDIWKTPAPLSDKDMADAEDAYMLHLHRMQEKNISFELGLPSVGSPVSVNKKNKKGIIKLIAGAAIAASMLYGAFVYLQHTQAKPGTHSPAQAMSNINEITTRFGSKSKIQLPDGSTVWLNAGSSLIYNKDFGIEKREVEITGEGFFDVTKNASMPFIIKTRSFDIKVLGTVFNVKAYPDDETSETSLLEGKIEVSIKSRPNDKIILAPKEKLVVENNARPASVAVSSPDPTLKQEPIVAISKLKYSPLDSSVTEVQWKDNILAFDDEKMEDVALKMERWFDVDIEIKEEALNKKRLTGKFENENIEQALEALAYTSTDAFTFKRNGRKITIYKPTH